MKKQFNPYCLRPICWNSARFEMLVVNFSNPNYIHPIVWEFNNLLICTIVTIYWNLVVDIPNNILGKFNFLQSNVDLFYSVLNWFVRLTQKFLIWFLSNFLWIMNKFIWYIENDDLSIYKRWNVMKSLQLIYSFWLFCKILIFVILLFV